MMLEDGFLVIGRKKIKNSIVRQVDLILTGKGKSY